MCVRARALACVCEREREFTFCEVINYISSLYYFAWGLGLGLTTYPINKPFLALIKIPISEGMF